MDGNKFSAMSKKEQMVNSRDVSPGGVYEEDNEEGRSNGFDTLMNKSASAMGSEAAANTTASITYKVFLMTTNSRY